MRLRFPVSSDHLELLHAFENSTDLNHLSEIVGRDPSVVSRNLQRLGEDYPLITKIKRRWTITPLGRKINEETREYLKKIEVELKMQKESQKEASFPANTLLIVLNAQQALHDPALGKRNNSLAEINIVKLLERWRKNERPILHVRHVTEDMGSILHPDSPGFPFMEGIEPQRDEWVIDKTKASAFSQTELTDILARQNIDTIILTGFTANECVDATARSASDLGFTTYVIDDATAMFDFTGDEGKLIKADRVHRLTMANLNLLFARVISTDCALDLESKSEL